MVDKRFISVNKLYFINRLSREIKVLHRLLNNDSSCITKYNNWNSLLNKLLNDEDSLIKELLDYKERLSEELLVNGGDFVV